MKEFQRKLEELLAERHGVDPEFTAQLAPLLGSYARSQPAAADWERVLDGISRAWQLRSEELESLDETRVLIRQFVAELKGMDETLKVLAVYLERLRDRLQEPTRSRTLH